MIPLDTASARRRLLATAPLQTASTHTMETAKDKTRSAFTRAFFKKVSGSFGDALAVAWVQGDVDQFNSMWEEVRRHMTEGR